VTDRKQARAPLEDILSAVFAAGCRWASLREKDLPAAEQVALARRLLAVARPCGARVSLHGDPRLACEAGAGGVHLSAGADASAARALLGADALVGLSIHAGDDLARIDPAAVDYLVAGPAYETASKPGYGPCLGPSGIASLARSTAIPILAIGGLDAGNAAPLLRAGAAGVAVMGPIMRAADPGILVRALLAAQVDQPRPR
jgi:thiamine-phosphate pyrophosphorylase